MRRGQKHHKIYSRDGTSLKNKFQKMSFKKKPTGVASISVQDLRAQKIKLLMDREQCIGKISLNGTLSDDDSDDDGADSCNGKIEEGLVTLKDDCKRKIALKGTHIFDVAGLPSTKHRKEDKVAHAITVLGERNVEAASTLAAAVKNLGGSNNKSSTSDDLSRRLNTMESEIHTMVDQQKVMSEFFSKFIESQKSATEKKDE